MNMNMNSDQRNYLFSQLDHYRQSWVAGCFAYRSFDRAEELLHLEIFERFVRATPDCFARSTLFGHVTGSAMVVNAGLNRVLLTHHRKLGKWLQLGGHADDEIHPDRIALREACEESGLQDLVLMGSVPINPFDLDIHRIPARQEVPAHYHYDIRFLLLADDAKPIQCSAESNDLRWVSLEAAYGFTTERSMHRQFDKLAFFRENSLLPAPLAGYLGPQNLADPDDRKGHAAHP